MKQTVPPTLRRTSTYRLLGAAIALATAVSLPAAHASGVTEATIRAAEKKSNDWPSHGRTYDEQRYSSLDQINQGNVESLGLAWQFKLDVDRGVEATPIVVDGVMYTTGAFSIVYALDAISGKLLWKYDPQVPRERAGAGCCDVVNRGVAIWGDKVFVGSYDGRLIAINAKTGKKAWEVDTLIDRSRSYTITGAPRVVHGKVIIGNGGADMTGVRGYVSAFDAKNGKLVWRFYTVPGDPKLPPENEAMAMAQKTWFGDTYGKVGGGGTVWDSMAYDPELNLLYFGVGNGYYWNWKMRSEGKGDNLFLSSIVAINPDTGKYVWHYQTTPGEMWDYTATQHIMLAELPINGKPTKVLMQAPKNGFFYVIDRRTGKLLSAEKYAPANWASHIDLATGRPVLTGAADYLSGGTKLVTPSFIGAHNWHPMSFNPQTGLVYIPSQQGTVAALTDSPESVPKGGNIAHANVGVDLGPMPEDTASQKQMMETTYKGKLLAWDPVKQKAAWSVDYPTIYNGGTLSTAGGLVFEGTATGRLRAYAADTGKQLWDAPANTGVMAAPVTFSVKGEQYVTFMVGSGGFFFLGMGPLAEAAKVKADARVLTFKLGGKAEMPAARNEPVSLPELLPQPADAAVVAKGRKLFADTCSRCHGAAAVSGGVLPDLRYLTREKHALFSATVRGARANKGMPNFGDVLSTEDIDALQQYVIQRAHDLNTALSRQ